MEGFFAMVKEYGVIALIGGGISHLIKVKWEEINQRKSLAVSLLAEINGLIGYYKTIELIELEKTAHINIQSVEEEYMTIYNGAGSKLSLLKMKDIEEVVSFYTYLKAHIDTIRVLAKMQSRHEFLTAAVEVFGHKNNSVGVVAKSLSEFQSTHDYALRSQSEMYLRAERVKAKLEGYI